MKTKRLNSRKYTKKTMPLSFEEKLLRELANFKNTVILAAFSGGKDSLSLLDFINKTKNDFNIRLFACHINHGLRINAEKDETFCRDFCSENNIPLFIERANGAIISGGDVCGIEAAARKYRYDILADTALKNKCDFIFTAHTRSDNVESFFVDLYTGSSLFTMGGIRCVSGNIVRPMLNITSEEVERYVFDRGLKPVYDDSNDDDRFVRNRLRHKLIPVLYECGGAFEKSVIRLQEESVKLKDYFDKRTRSAVIGSGLAAVLDRKIFSGFDDIEKEYLLGKIFAPRFRFSKRNLHDVLSFLDDGSSKRLDLPNGYMIEQSFGRIRVFERNAVDLFCIEKASGIDRIYMDGAEIAFNDEYAARDLIIRNRRGGDRFKGKKLKDLFIEKKVDLFDRDRAVIIEAGGNIIWVEYVSRGGFVSVKRQND